MHLDETQLLLDEISAQGHPSAEGLRKAWAIDQFLSRNLSAADAARHAGLTEKELNNELKKRGLLHRLAAGTASGPVDVPTISIILPAYNEEENLRELHRRLTSSLTNVDSYEILFVNNGSRDASRELILELQRNDAHVRLIDLSRNFGHQGAISAGLDMSRGQAVIMMDADLQDPPEVLGDMIAKWREGADVVYAVRENRKDSAVKKASYFGFYRVLRWFSEIEIPMDSGDFCLMDRAVVDHLKALPEKVRFLRGLRAWLGFKQVPFHYERAARHAGESKYPVRHLVKFALDGIISFSSLPLRIAAYSGVLVSVAGVVYLASAVVSYFIHSEVPQGWTSTIALILLLGGAQLMLLGVLGEYVSRIYDESKDRPSYVVRSIVEPDQISDAGADEV